MLAAGITSGDWLVTVGTLVGVVAGCCLTAWFGARTVARACMRREHAAMRDAILVLMQWARDRGFDDGDAYTRLRRWRAADDSVFSQGRHLRKSAELAREPDDDEGEYGA